MTLRATARSVMLHRARGCSVERIQADRYTTSTIDKHRVFPEAQPQPIVEHIQQEERKKTTENKGTEQSLGALESSYSLGICSNKTNMVGTVDGNVNNPVNRPHLLPPTPTEIDKLVKKLRKMKLPPLQDEDTQDNYYGLHRRLSPEDIQIIANRYKANESISSLSREYGISRPSLRSLLREAGVSPRRKGMKPEDADRAVQLYETGLTINEVIDKVGYSYGVINRMLHKRGVVVRPRRNQG